MSGVLLLGGGGHCRSVIDVLEMCNQPIAGIVHGPDCALKPVLNYPVLGRDEDLPALFRQHSKAFVTLGQIKTPQIRQKLYAMLSELGYTLPSFISPLAHFSRHATLGLGSIIMHQALVNAGASIGNNCIINTQALIEHDCNIASHCHIAVGALLCGEVQVGEGSFVGSNATVKQGVTIGKRCIVGMGCTLKKDLTDGEVYV